MFEAAVSRFVKAVGKDSLKSVPNLDEAAKCVPLQVRIIIKKELTYTYVIYCHRYAISSPQFQITKT